MDIYEGRYTHVAYKGTHTHLYFLNKSKQRNLQQKLFTWLNEALEICLWLDLGGCKDLSP